MQTIDHGAVARRQQSIAFVQDEEATMTEHNRFGRYQVLQATGRSNYYVNLQRNRIVLFIPGTAQNDQT